MALETDVAETWIRARLAANATIASLVGSRIYADPAPRSAAHPLIVVSPPAGDDTSYIGGYRAMTTLVYTVRAIATDDGSLANFDLVAAAIDTALHRQSGTALGGHVRSCTRIRPFSEPATEEGRVYQQKGGTYRLQVRSD